VSDSAERLVNLALYFADARAAVSAVQVHADVVGYPEGQDLPTFLRMFERDKDDLRRMGFVIESDAEGNYHLDRAGTYARAIELDPAEAAVVWVAAGSLLEDDSFPFATDLRLALAKITAEQPGTPELTNARLADEDPAVQGGTALVLTEAATARKSVAFDYTNSAGASAPHQVEPYGLFVYDGRWYLVGRDIAKSEVRTYTLARMWRVAVNAAAPKTPDFERPDDFDVARWVSLPFQYGPASAEFDATLVFSPAASWRAAALTRDRGCLETDANGSATWHVQARDPSRLIRFVIEAGPGVDLVAPEAMVAKLRESLSKVVNAHA
jgi:proteasome accessory factor B